MWIESYEFADSNRMKHYAKKHRREYVSCLAKLASEQQEDAENENG